MFSRRRSRRRAAAARGRTRGGRVATFAGSILLITITISERARAECVRPSAHPPRDDTFLPTLRRTSLLRKLIASSTRPALSGSTLESHLGKPPKGAIVRSLTALATARPRRPSASSVSFDAPRTLARARALRRRRARNPRAPRPRAAAPSGRRRERQSNLGIRSRPFPPAKAGVLRGGRRLAPVA